MRCLSRSGDRKSRRGFTLLEVLMVLGLLALLAAVVVLVLNPVELLRRSRDSRRFSEFNAINTALSIYQIEVLGGGSGMGATSTIYVSLPDTSAMCSNLSLPVPPSGWGYNCVPSSNLRDIDGNGWIPIDFTQISSGAPFAHLAIDPTNANATGSRLYYTYVTDGTVWELGARPESQKYASSAETDNGDDATVYEFGNDLTIASSTHGP